MQAYCVFRFTPLSIARAFSTTNARALPFSSPFLHPYRLPRVHSARVAAARVTQQPRLRRIYLKKKKTNMCGMRAVALALALASASALRLPPAKLDLTVSEG